MIKSINKYFFFLVFLSSFTVLLNGMEEAVSNCNAQPEESAVTVKNTSKRKRKNRKKKKETEKPEFQKLVNVNPDVLAEATSINNLKKLFNFSEDEIKNIEALNALANVLLMQDWIINEFKSIAKDTADLASTSISEPITCFSVTNDGKSICDCEKTENHVIKELMTSEAKALALQLVAPLVRSEKNIWNNKEQINKFYLRSSNLINHNNEEICSIAKWVKNVIAADRLNQKLKWTCLNLIARCGIENQNFGENSQTNKEKDLSNSIARLLLEKKVFKVVRLLVPNIIPLIIRFIQIDNYFVNVWYELDDSDDIFVANQLNKLVKETISWYNEYRVKYQDLYKTVLLELNNITKSLDRGCRQSCIKFSLCTYLIPTLKGLPKNLSTVSLDNIKNEDNNNQTNDFICDLNVALKNKKSPLVSKKPKKKKSRNKYRKKIPNLTGEPEIEHGEYVKQASNEKIEFEHLKLPCYTSRILNYWDPSYIQRESVDHDSTLVHTYNPIADAFIMKHGRKIMQQNQTFGEQLDEAYYMPGQIEYENGRIETVLFCVCLGRENFCYHRGFKKRSTQQLFTEFGNNEFESDQTNEFEVEGLIKKRLNFKAQNDIYPDNSFDENEFCIKINDPKNHVLITLFKPDIL